MIRKTDPLGKIYEYAYDGNDNLIYEKDPAGREKYFVYNELDQLIGKQLPDNNYSYDYDIRGNLISASNSHSSILFDVDVDGRILSESTSGLGVLSDYPQTTVNYEYNGNGQRTLMTDSRAGVTSYGYDIAGRLINVTNQFGQSFGFGYDQLNRLKSITRPNINTSFSYQGSSGVTRISHSVGSTEKSFLAFTRNAQELVTSITDSTGTESYTYDSRNYLASVSRPADRLPASDFDVENFQYDELGNRILDQLGNSTYDSKKQLLTENYKYKFTYDSNGNLSGRTDKLSGEYTLYGYSSENQLTSIKTYQTALSITPIKEVTYYYDAIGRRIKKSVTDHQNPLDIKKTFTRQYVYDGQEILMEFDGNANLLARYTHSGLRTDDVLSVTITAEGVNQKLASHQGAFTYLKDHLGTVREIANVNGDIIQKQSYTAYGILKSITDGNGNEISASPVLNTSYSFTGREYDKESGLYYYRARYYDASTGRFLQEDPHPGKVLSPITIVNKYLYSGGNPTNFIDPSGKDFWSDTFGSGGFFDQLARDIGDFVRSEDFEKLVIGVAAAFVGGLAAVAAVGSSVGLGASISAGIAAGAVAGAATGYLVGGLFNLWNGKDFDENLERNLSIGIEYGVWGGISGGVGAGAANQSFFNFSSSSFAQTIFGNVGLVQFTIDYLVPRTISR